MVTTIIILFITASMFVWGKIRSDIVSLMSLLALVLTNILTTDEALMGFSNPIVIMIAALFIIGGAISQTGLAGIVSNNLLRLAGDNSKKLFILVMLVTVIIGLFLSNTGTVAMLMPIVISLAIKSNTNVRRLLMPMAFASSIGGMMTLIGTPPVLIVHNILIKEGYKGLQFFSTLPVGLILLVVGMFLLWILTKSLDTKGRRDDTEGKTNVKSPEELASEYLITDNLYRLEIPNESQIIGKSLFELDITKNHSIAVTEIRTRSYTPLGKNVTTRVPEADTQLTSDNLLYVIGNYDKVCDFSQKYGLKFLDNKSEELVNKPKFAGKFRFHEIGMAEVVILSNSPLHNKLVRNSQFRTNYNVNILSIQRKDNYIIDNIKDQKMQAGDMLLVQGTWEDIDRLSRLENEIVVIGQPTVEASKVTLGDKAPFAAVVVLLMVLSMVFNWLTPVISVLMAAVTMVLGRCFRTVKDAYRTINWESVILFAAMMPLATAMEKSGTSSIISNGIVEQTGSFGPYAVLAAIMFATSLLTMFISNTATAILFAPITMQAATSLGVSPYPFLIGVALAASMCLASPFSTPPNAMVMSAGKYSFMDYVRVGLPLQIVFIVLMIFVLPLIYPF